MLSSKMRRRNLVTGALASVGVVALNKGALSQTAQNPTTILIQESGRCGDWPLVIGAMLTDDMASHEEHIQRLRQDLGYKEILKWSATSTSRVSFATKLIDYFIANEDLRFRALIVKDDQNRFPVEAVQGDARYFAKYRQLFESATDALGPFNIVTQKRDELRYQLLCQDLQRINGAVGVDQRGRPVGNLGQLVSLLCGCVRGETEKRNDTQKQIYDRLLAALNGTTLLQIKTEKFWSDASAI
jgi:hypothetical protein